MVDPEKLLLITSMEYAIHDTYDGTITIHRLDEPSLVVDYREAVLTDSFPEVKECIIRGRRFRDARTGQTISAAVDDVPAKVLELHYETIGNLIHRSEKAEEKVQNLLKETEEYKQNLLREIDEYEHRIIEVNEKSFFQRVIWFIKTGGKV